VAQVRAHDVVHGDGRHAATVCVYCPGCREWWPVAGEDHVARTHAALADRQRPVAQPDIAGSAPIAAVMTRHIVCVRPDLPVETLTGVMLERGIGGIPVVDRRDRLLGIVTKSDVLRGGWEQESWQVETTDDGERRIEPIPRALAGEIMTPFVFTLPGDATIARAAALMAYEGIDRLCVVSSDGSLIGVITSLDIMRWMAQAAGFVVAGHTARPREVVAAPGPVMIVDDDVDLLADYEEVLRDEGYAVVTAANGAEAIARLRAAPAPSVIMLDLRMPVMDGWTFHEALRRDPSTARIPVVLMSGTGDVASEVDRLGVDGYLSKPIALGSLLGTVEQYYRS
jgi:CheY-like chemotaxis protein